MYFPKYWSQGESDGYSCWGWSDISTADAEQKGKASARRLAARLAHDAPPPDSADPKSAGPESSDHEYYGGTRPPREQVIEKVDGPTPYVISRNAYGSLVLNTASVAILDIDAPSPPSPESRGFFSWLLGKPSPTVPAAESVETHVRAWADRNRSLGVRLYRTAAGFRLMITSAIYTPSEFLTASLVKDLGVDERYVTLCRSQKSFRARLTPKPWRCSLVAPPSRWPHPSPAAEAQFKAWLDKYDEKITSYACCHLVFTLGPKEAHPSIVPILNLHDRYTKAEGSLPLA